MTNFDTTELKLRTTPTGGVPGEHSAYYRHLMSAGYKGYMQGMLGGASFYGALGLAIGALVGVPAAFALGPGALMFIPTVGAIGALKGATVFSGIGSTAAINAEAADLMEQRKYLLDRYYELPEGPEGDRQAEFIRKELVALSHERDRNRPFFHWKTVAVCAAMGAGLALAFTFTPLSALAAAGPVLEALHIAAAWALPAGASAALVGTTTTAIAVGVSAMLGGLMGAVLGIDRSHVRQWMDGAENLLYDDTLAREGLARRAQLLERLRAARDADKETKLILERGGQLGYRMPTLLPSNAIEVPALNPATQTAPAQPEAPALTVDVAGLTHENRLATAPTIATREV